MTAGHVRIKTTTDAIKAARVYARRDVAAHWWHRPWADVFAAAQAGEPGLSTQVPKATELDPRPEYAALRQGDTPHTDRCFLHKQAW